MMALLLAATPAWSHPYLPLHEGDVMVLDYHFHVDAKKKQPKPPDQRGRMIIKAERTEQKQGKPWVRFRVSYRDIPYSIEDVLFWRREENGKVYTGSVRNGKFSETLELPSDVSVGAEWDYDDGERSRRKVTKRLDLDVGGRKLVDCVEVTRSIAKKERSSVVNRNYYCRDTGEVKSYFMMPSPLGDYVTETSLRSDEPK